MFRGAGMLGSSAGAAGARVAGAAGASGAARASGASGPLGEGETALACSSLKGLVGSEKGFSTFSLVVLGGRSQGLPPCGGVRLRLAPAAAAVVGALNVLNAFPWLRRTRIRCGIR